MADIIMRKVAAGWVKVKREIIDHWCSSDPNFFAVWIRLVTEANYRDNKKIINGTKITIKRGQLIFGLNAFSSRSGVSVSKLRRILKILLDEGMIDRQVFNKYSIISIVNYKEHQGIDSQTAAARQADDKQTATLKEDKEGKEGKEKIYSTKKTQRKNNAYPISKIIQGNRELPEEYRHYATKHGHPDPETEWEMFINFWEGNGGAKVNWLATWRNRVLASKKSGWYTSGNKDGNQNGSARDGVASIMDITAKIIAERDCKET